MNGKDDSNRRRVAIYARVSTFDKGQNPETQLRELRRYAEARGLEVAHELVDIASGTRDTRPNYRILFDLARKRSIDIVLVWRYDRFARSTQALVNALVEFRDLGVDFISYQENIDTSSPQGKMVFAIMASLAEFESSLISERVKAGMARARAEGVHVGRPNVSAEVKRRIASLKRADPRRSVRAISREVGVSVGTVSKCLKEA
jgi:DNA invertase Pin-like site-specific DNA recombinase